MPDHKSHFLPQTFWVSLGNRYNRRGAEGFAHPEKRNGRAENQFLHSHPQWDVRDPKRDWEVAEWSRETLNFLCMFSHLPSICEALHSIPRAVRKEKKRKPSLEPPWWLLCVFFLNTDYVNIDFVNQCWNFKRKIIRWFLLNPSFFLDYPFEGPPAEDLFYPLVYFLSVVYTCNTLCTLSPSHGIFYSG